MKKPSVVLSQGHENTEAGAACDQPDCKDEDDGFLENLTCSICWDVIHDCVRWAFGSLQGYDGQQMVVFYFVFV